MGGKYKYKISPTWLYEQYYVNKLSLNNIADLLGTTHCLIKRRMIKYNFVLRSKSESLSLNHHLKGKKQSQKTKDKISETKSIFKKSVYTKIWLEQKYIDEKLSMNQIAKIVGCTQVVVWEWMKEYNIKARPLSEAIKLNLPIIIRKRGCQHHQWQGGLELHEAIRNCTKNINWKKAVMKRDNYKCVICNNKFKHYDIDHIKPFAIILFENNITSLEQALMCEELFDINNGRTLCKKCHINTDTYGHGTKILLDELRASKASSDATTAIIPAP